MDKIDQQEAERLWRQYAGGIVRTLQGYEADARLREDLAQDIFCAIAQSAARITTADNERAYVFRIAHNVAVDHIARRVKDGAEPHEPSRLAQLQESNQLTPGDCPADLMQRSREQTSLLRAIQALEAPYRQVILLLLEDMTANEIAQVLQLNAGAVRVRINRAKTELRRLLQYEA